MHRPHVPRGFTLVEMLVVVTLLAILAKLALPSLKPLDDQRLDVAASEVRGALRVARSEAMRRGKSVLVDGESSPGRIKLLLTTCTSTGTPSAVADPRTKAAFDVDVAGGSYSAGVQLTPQFLASDGNFYAGLVFGPDGTATDVCQVSGMNSKGTPQAGSQVQLSFDSKLAAVSVTAATGWVSGP